MNEKIRRDFRGERIVKFFSFRFVLAGRGVWREGIVRVSRYENFLPLEGGYRVYSPVSIWIQSTPGWNTLGKRRIPTLSRPTRLHSKGLACLLLWLTVLSFRVSTHPSHSVHLCRIRVTYPLSPTFPSRSYPKYIFILDESRPEHLIKKIQGIKSSSITALLFKSILLLLLLLLLLLFDKLIRAVTSSSP